MTPPHRPFPRRVARPRRTARPARTGALAAVPLLALALTSCGGSADAVVVSRSAPAHLSLHPGGAGQVRPSVDLPVVVGYPGTVTHVDVALGQKVTAGQPLLGLNSEALSAAASQIEARLSLEQATLKRVQADGKATTTQLAALKGQVELDSRLLDAARGRTAQLTAPVSGIIGAVSARPGGVFKANDSLVEIIDASSVDVTFPVPVSYFGQVKIGMTAQLTGLGSGGATLPAKVVGVAPQTLADGESFEVRVSSDDPQGISQPGRQTFVRLDLATDVPVAVNKLAVLNERSRPQLFVVAAGVARQREVVVGLQDDATVQILSGLAAGEDVVIAGVQSLTDGAKVTVSRQVSGS